MKSFKLDNMLTLLPNSYEYPAPLPTPCLGSGALKENFRVVRGREMYLMRSERRAVDNEQVYFCGLKQLLSTVVTGSVAQDCNMSPKNICFKDN